MIIAWYVSIVQFSHIFVTIGQCAWMHVFMYIFIQICVCMYMCTRVYMHACMRVYLNVRYVCIYACMHVCFLVSKRDIFFYLIIFIIFYSINIWVYINTILRIMIIDKGRIRMDVNVSPVVCNQGNLRSFYPSLSLSLLNVTLISSIVIGIISHFA